MTLDRTVWTDTMSADMDTTPCEICGLRILSEDDAMKLLTRTILKIKGKCTQDLLRVVRELQCLQLGLDLAICWLNQREHQSVLLGCKYDLGLFHEVFQQRTDRIKTRNSYRKLRDQHERTIYSMYEVAREQLRDRYPGARVGEVLDHMAHISPDLVDRWDIQEFHRDMDEGALGAALLALHDYCVVTMHHGKVRIHPTIQRVVRYRLRDEGDDEYNILNHNLNYHKGIKVDHSMALWGYASTYEDLLRKHSDVPGAVTHNLLKQNRLGDALIFAELSVKALRVLPEPPEEGIRAVLLQFGELFERLTEAPFRYSKKLRAVESLGLPWMLDVMDPVTWNNYHCFWLNQSPYKVDEVELAPRLLVCSENLDVRIRATPYGRGKVEGALQMLDETSEAGILNERMCGFIRGECEAHYQLMCGDFAGALESFRVLTSKLREGGNAWSHSSLRAKINEFYTLKLLGMEPEASQVLSELRDELGKMTNDEQGNSFVMLSRKLADLLLHFNNRPAASETYAGVVLYQEELDKRNREDAEWMMENDEPIERFRDNIKPYPGYKHDPRFWERVQDSKLERTLRLRMRDKKRQKWTRKLLRKLETKMDLAYVQLESGMAGEALGIVRGVHETQLFLVKAHTRQPFESKAMMAYCVFLQGKVGEALEILESALGEQPSLQYPPKPKEDVVKEFLIQSAIAKCHLSLGDRAKASSLMEGVYNGLVAILGPDHPQAMATKEEMNAYPTTSTTKEERREEKQTKDQVETEE